MNRTIKIVFVSLIVIFSFSSCVMQQGVSLSSGGSGWATTDLSVTPFFATVLEDFQPFSEEENPRPLLDVSIENFTTELSRASSTSYVSSLKLNDYTYFIDFTFSSLTELLKDLNNREEQSIVTITKTKNNERLDFFLDINNYPELTRIVPFLADENFETFGPLYNEGMSEDEYYEMISYILDESGPEEIKNSIISLRLTTPSKIISQRGGVKEGNNVIRFDIPLIDILLLSEPITFYATW